MFISESFLVAHLKNYSLTLNTQSDFLNIEGKFQIESRFFIPSNLIELNYIFPFQTVDRLFLKTTGEKCQPSIPAFRCFVYTNTAKAALSKDGYFNLRDNPDQNIPIIAHFKLNSLLREQEKFENRRERSFYRDINSQFEQFSFQRQFKLATQTRKKLSLKEENNLELNLATHIKLQKYEQDRYGYQQVSLQIPSWEEVLKTGVLLKYGLPSNFSNFHLAQLTGKIKKKGGETLESFLLRPSFPREVSLEEKLWEKFKKFLHTPESIELELHFSNQKDSTVVYLELVNSVEKKESSKELMIYVERNDSLFKDISFDNSWIIESLVT